MPQSLTPLMRQYLDLKEKYKDCLLLFRLGDFYELFFEDAKTASQELEIVLTGRDCGLSERAPMCGVPYHSVESYINKLIGRGYKVALCEQISDPKLSKGLVERDVVRVITRGTVIEETMLEEGSNNFLFSIFIQNDGLGFAYADVSTGCFYLGEIKGGDMERQLLDEMARVQPSEILANEALQAHKALMRKLSSSYYLNQYADWAYEEKAAYGRLTRHFQVAGLHGFGCEQYRYGIRAAGALLCYLEETQKNALAHITAIRTVNRYDYMVLDAVTRRNLELTRPLHYGGDKKHTLVHLLDKSKTAMGARAIRMWIEQPLQRVEEIALRHQAVFELKADGVRRMAIREALRGVYDMERLTSRISYKTAHARDCAALRTSLGRLPELIGHTADCTASALTRLSGEIDPMEDIRALLARAIAEEPPATTKESGMIRAGYHKEVDELRDIAENGKNWLRQMEAAEREATGIKNLRIHYNRVFGYYIEVTKSYQNLVPYHYHRRQTLANAERYVTPALKELEEKILSASDQLIALEQQLFEQLRETLQANTVRLQKTAALIAELDAYCAFAEAAAEYNYCMPEMTTDGRIEITGGRHPIVERAQNDAFVPNDAALDNGDNRLILITGPNMAGKSTYMRQIALITLMAHIGSFVPAESARIAIVDRICTRVGASDDLAAGQSTFMVEMSETAGILHSATKNSLLLLDEIGRGTSTFDGLSIAWAVLEHIAENLKAKTLFATHYHELTELEGKLGGIQNARTAVKEVGEDILFLHRIMRGGADKSFGIQVARLAGLPEAVIKRAKEILKALERADLHKTMKLRVAAQEQQQLSLLAAQKKNALLEELARLDIDQLTPVGALTLLNDLHQEAKRIRGTE